MFAIFYPSPWQLYRGCETSQDRQKSIGVWQEELLAFPQEEPLEQSVWALEASLKAGC